MSDYRLKTGKIGGMAEKAISVYQKIEDTVVGGYKKIENSFVETFLEKTEDDHNMQENKENKSK